MSIVDSLPVLMSPVNVFVKHIYCHAGTALFLFFILLSSCTTTTGTHVKLDETALKNIETIGVVVRKEQDFSVRLSREKLGGAGPGFQLGGLLGLGVESVVRASTDSGHEKRLKPELGTFDPVPEMAEMLRSNLESSKRFRMVSVLGGDNRADPKAMPYDGTLEVSIREWGLRLCVGMSDNLETALNLHARLFLPKENKVLWERDEVYRDGTCKSMEAIEADKTLIPDIVRKAVDAAAGRITSEILFP